MKLKSCPFCGEEAVLEEHPNFPGEFRVKCANIYHCAIKQDQWDFKEGAINAWNKRNIELSSEAKKDVAETAPLYTKKYAAAIIDEIKEAQFYGKDFDTLCASIEGNLEMLLKDVKERML